MPFDGMLLNRVVRDLKKYEGAKIGKIQCLSDEEVLFYLHKPGMGSTRLALSAHSNTCRLYLCSNQKEPLPNPSAFVMMLRKRISQGYITEIEQMGYDRLVRFHISASNELSDRVEYDLYAEMMGKYANLVLVDTATNTIIDCLKRIPVFENSKRLLHPGAEYTLPEKPDRYDPLHPGPLNLEKSLVSQIEGFSPTLSREFLFRMQNGQSYDQIMEELENSPNLYTYNKEYHCLPLTHLKQPEKAMPLMDGLERLFEADETRKRIALQCGDVFKAVDREVKKLSRKLPRLEETLEESQDYDRYRQYGGVLFANLYLEKQPVMELPSFEEEGVMLSIPIDMRYSLKDNANLFYKKYHKLKRSIEILNEQIEECQDQLDYFETLKEQLNYCSADDVLEIRQELAGRHFMRLKQNSTRQKRKKMPNIVEIRMGDATIYAGKNNLQNQYITWTLAHRNDLWFHVKDYHGSHVVLRSENPTENEIRFAASLAAWFSKGRNSSSVPIDYTRISNLKKVPKKGPGFVTMKSYQTIYIDPDAPKIEAAIKSRHVDEDETF